MLIFTLSLQRKLSKRLIVGSIYILLNNYSYTTPLIPMPQNICVNLMATRRQIYNKQVGIEISFAFIYELFNRLICY